jgi:hypothetical protein
MPDLTPDQTEAVRRALSDARATDPLPTDVAARLDHALDGLYAERSTATPAVASLEARRRRRNAARMLVAAAAVVVGGFGIDAMVGHGLIGGQSANDAGSSEADRDGGGNMPALPSAQPPTDSNLGTGSTADVPDGFSLDELLNGPSVPQVAGAYEGFFSTNLYDLRRETLTKDVARVAHLSDLIETALTRCVTPADGESAVLVTYEQLVDLYYCPTGHSGRLIRTIVLSAR